MFGDNRTIAAGPRPFLCGRARTREGIPEVLSKTAAPRNSSRAHLLSSQAQRKDFHMGNDRSTNFPPAGEPKQDPKKTLG